MTKCEGRALGGLTVPGGLPTNTAATAEFPVHPANKGRGTGAPKPQEGLKEQLHSLRDELQGFETYGKPYSYANPSIGPDLKVWAVPQDDAAKLSRRGLVSTRKFAKPVRNGLSGISRPALKCIRRTCRLLEANKRHMALWTVTLPDADYLDLAESGKWPILQRRLIDLLIRLLIREGDEALVIGVAEIGCRRARRTGRPDPHLHILTSGYGKRDRTGQWLLRPDVMDRLVNTACQYAGLPSRSRRSCSNIAGIKKSVTKYLSKYLTKQPLVDIKDLLDKYKSLIPRQWWNRSANAKCLLDGCISRFPTAFAAFIVRECSYLETHGLGRGGIRTVGWRKTKIYELPIEVFCFQFDSVASARQAWDLFCEWVLNDEAIPQRAGPMSGCLAA